LRSNQVEAPFGTASAVTVGTGAADDQRVAVALKLMRRADVAEQGVQIYILKFDDAIAPFAHQVLMLRVAVVVLEKRPLA
jgi:hypothetical protein